MTERRSSSEDATANRGDGPSPDADDPVAQYAVSTEATQEEFLAAAKLYARDVVDTYELTADVRALEWSVSTRAKRRAGVVKHSDGDPREVRLTWGHFVEHGWPAAAGTIRHELVHVHLLNERDDAGHGEAFRRLADRLDAPRHCERFTDPAWWVVCTDCGNRIARYRRSKLVEHPEDYRCADCGGDFRVEAAD